MPGCHSARNLEVHHIIPQGEGGPHALWNIGLVCSGHHAAVHDGLLVITGTAPRDLVFRWPYEPPLAVGLDAKARWLAIKERAAKVFGEPLDDEEDIPMRALSIRSLIQRSHDVPAGTRRRKRR